jgi:hypothetical protein
MMYALNPGIGVYNVSLAKTFFGALPHIVERMSSVDLSRPAAVSNRGFECPWRYGPPRSRDDALLRPAHTVIHPRLALYSGTEYS